MSQRYAQLALALMLPCLPLGMAMGASGNCNALGQLPAVIEVGEGLQTELQSPVAITRLAIAVALTCSSTPNNTSTWADVNKASGPCGA